MAQPVKQPININFAQGVDLKTDDKQVPVGKFLSLVNSVFDSVGRLTKRNGFPFLATLPNTTSSYLTTLSGDLQALGPSLLAYSSGQMSWVNKGSTYPTTIDTLPLIRNALNQSQADCAIAPNGLVCTVYTEVNGSAISYKYAVADSVTGQNIVAPTIIPVSTGVITYSPRVFLLGNNFILLFGNVVTSNAQLQYVAVSTITGLVTKANTAISTSFTNAQTLAYDGVVSNGRLFLAWNGGASSGIKMAYLAANLTASSVVVRDGSHEATILSVCVDEYNQGNPIIWATYFNSATSNGYSLAVDFNLNPITTATQVISALVVLNLATAASNRINRIFYEVYNNYSDYDTSIPTDYVGSRTITQPNVNNNPGTVGTAFISVRGVGLASKAFVVSGVVYYLSAYQSPYQPTYFLIDGSTSTSAAPIVTAKLAYQNGGGYLINGLPSVTVDGTTASVIYLRKDLVQAVNKNTNVPSGSQVNGIYSQTGVNLAKIGFDTSGLISVEQAGNLQLTGGFLWNYDGYLPVEHNFHLYPDSVEAVLEVNPTATGDTSSTVNPTVIINVSDTSKAVVGMLITGTDIPGGTTIVSFTSNTITMSAASVGTHSGLTITFHGSQAAQKYFYQVTYEWADNQGNVYRSAPSIPVTVTTTSGSSIAIINVPTLRLTYKIASPAKIVIYRWSVAQQSYYQVTSITSPLLNNTTIDSVAFTDVLSDSTILGNNLLYTTGGVVENTGAPASNNVTLFDTRVWLVDAEDKNLLWFSKQVVEDSPVEMSDLFTIFVSPSIGAQGPTGPITAIAPMDDKLIIFKDTAIYYINGTGPDITGANNQYSQPTFITSTVGCSTPKSIVMTPMGLMFKSNKGIWLLGRGLAAQYIGAEVESFNSQAVTSALAIPNTNQVRFGLSDGTVLMYDYYVEQWGIFQGIPSVSATLFEDSHTIVNQYGQVLQESPNTYLDGASPVLMSFKTSWLNVAGLRGYMRAFWFYFLGTYLSPHKLQVEIGYDYNNSPTQYDLITPVNQAGPYGDDPFYGGDGHTTYGGPNTLENWRVFLQRQRCRAFQVSIQEVFDSSFGTVAGPGLTLSGLNLIVGVKKAYAPIPQNQQVG